MTQYVHSLLANSFFHTFVRTEHRKYVDTTHDKIHSIYDSFKKGYVTPVDLASDNERHVLLES